MVPLFFGCIGVNRKYSDANEYILRVHHTKPHFHSTNLGVDTNIIAIKGHASGKIIGWTEEQKKKNIETVIVPANASHILQPCDKYVKKSKIGCQELRDSLK